MDIIQHMCAPYTHVMKVCVNIYHPSHFFVIVDHREAQPFSTGYYYDLICICS